MTARPVKRSVTLKGHRTSISLEDAFWIELRRIAAEKGIPLNTLVAEVDVERGVDSGLASALRVFILRDLQSKLGRQASEA